MVLNMGWLKIVWMLYNFNISPALLDCDDSIVIITIVEWRAAADEIWFDVKLTLVNLAKCYTSNISNGYCYCFAII